MKKITTSTGGRTLKFERGDKMRRRYAKYLVDWRLRLPDPTFTKAGNTLRHPPAWYLDEEHILRRPVIGLYSLAQFAEWLLYKTQRADQGGKTHVLATRFFHIVRHNMAEHRHKEALDTPHMSRRLTQIFRGACRVSMRIGREAYEAYQDLIETRRRTSSKKFSIKPLDIIHQDMI